MMNNSYLVPFGELLDFLNKHRLHHEKSHISGISVLIGYENRHVGNVSDQDAFERFHGTWWEVIIPAGREFLPRCIYVADSLRDALRLKPGINLSPWSSSSDLLEQFSDDAEDWSEEVDFLDYAEMIGI